MSSETPPSSPGPAPEPSPGTNPGAPASQYDPKVVGIVAYLTFIGWIVALIMNNPKTEYGSFHIRQSLGIMLLFFASAIITMIPFLGWIVGVVGYLFGFVLWIIGLIGAIQEKNQSVPVLGPKSQEWFQAL